MNERKENWVFNTPIYNVFDFFFFSKYDLTFFLKVFEIRNTEDLTEEWLREKLGFFH